MDEKKEKISIIYNYHGWLFASLFALQFLVSTMGFNYLPYSLIVNYFYFLFLFLILTNYIYSLIQLFQIKKMVKIFSFYTLILCVPVYLILLFITNYFYYNFLSTNVVPMILIFLILFIIIAFLNFKILDKEINGEDYLSNKKITFDGNFKNRIYNENIPNLKLRSFMFLNIFLFFGCFFMVLSAAYKNIYLLIPSIIFLVVWFLLIIFLFIYFYKNKIINLWFLFAFLIQSLLLYSIYPILIYYFKDNSYFYELITNGVAFSISNIMVFIVLDLIQIMIFPYDMYFKLFIKKKSLF